MRYGMYALLVLATALPAAARAEYSAQLEFQSGCELVQTGDLTGARPLPFAKRFETKEDMVRCTASMPLLDFNKIFEGCALSVIEVPSGGGYACGISYRFDEVEFRYRYPLNDEGAVPSCSFICRYRIYL